LRWGHGSRLKVWIGDRAIGSWWFVFWRRGGLSSGSRRRNSSRWRGRRRSGGGSRVGKVLRSGRRSRRLYSILVLHELEKVKTR